MKKSDIYTQKIVLKFQKTKINIDNNKYILNCTTKRYIKVAIKFQSAQALSGYITSPRHMVSKRLTTRDTLDWNKQAVNMAVNCCCVHWQGALRHWNLGSSSRADEWMIPTLHTAQRRVTINFTTGWHIPSKLSLAMGKLVSWCLTSLFSTNMAISETKDQGWRAIPTQ